MSKFSYLVMLGLCALLSGALTCLVRNLAIAVGWSVAPASKRHLHRRPVPRAGGIAIFLTIVAAMAVVLLSNYVGEPLDVPTDKILGILGPATLVFLVGLADDIRSLKPKLKFFLQAVAATLLYVEGYRIHTISIRPGAGFLDPYVDVFVTVFWVLWVTNAFNLIDGIDGLAAGSALFSTLGIFFSAVLLGDHFAAILTIALAGAIIGFLRYNFYPATIFLGDSGSLTIGFVLSAIALTSSQKASASVCVAIPVLLFGLPLLDVALAVVRRFLRGKPLFEADADHIHHRLLKRGLTQWQVALALYGVTAVLALASVLLMYPGYVRAGLVFVLLTVGLLVGLKELRYHEFLEIRRLLNRALRQRRVIANNLRIRQFTDALRKCDSLCALAKVATEHLEPIGFDGLMLQVPALATSNLEPDDDYLQAPFSVNDPGELIHLWTRFENNEDADCHIGAMIIAENGRRIGRFAILYAAESQPLWFDTNLITGQELSSALAGAVQRSIRSRVPRRVLSESSLADLNVVTRLNEGSVTAGASAD